MLKPGSSYAVLHQPVKKIRLLMPERKIVIAIGILDRLQDWVKTQDPIGKLVRFDVYDKAKLPKELRETLEKSIGDCHGWQIVQLTDEATPVYNDGYDMTFIPFQVDENCTIGWGNIKGERAVRGRNYFFQIKQEGNVTTSTSLLFIEHEAGLDKEL